MSKYCGKCGREIAEDDFLCPYCGAIWGDRIYRVSNEHSSLEEETDAPLEEGIQPQITKPAEEVSSSKRWHWRNLLIVGVVVVTVTLILILFGPKDHSDEPTPSTLPPRTTAAPITTPPMSWPNASEPTVITPQRYTVQVIDQNGFGIAGVRIKNENSFTSVMVTVTDSEGVSSFMAFPDQAYVCILDVPQGYSREQIGVQIPYPEDTSFMIVVVDKNNGED